MRKERAPGESELIWPHLEMPRSVELRRLTRLRHSEDHERCVGVGLGSTVAVADVDPRFAEPRYGARQLPRTMAEGHLRDLGLGVISALAIQNRFSFSGLSITRRTEPLPFSRGNC